MKVLTLGDIVGRPGVQAVQERLPALIESEQIGFVVANAENAAGGSGITPKIADQLTAAGVDVITAGDHIWKKRELVARISEMPNLVRPDNYPPHSPGRGSLVGEARNGQAVAVLSLVGRVFMPPVDCPFLAADRAIEKLRTHTPMILVDMHCEATSEKVAMGWHLDGRVSLVFGTHTHIQTADERVLPGGTAYITDLGMTGPYDSVIGRDKHRVLKKFITNMPERFDVAEGDVRVCGAVTTLDSSTGKATEIHRIVLADPPA